MKNIRAYTTIAERRAGLEEELGLSLASFQTTTFLEEKKYHCENMIGFTQVPIGIAGPLRLKNNTGLDQSFFLPLATTEGALVASLNRGCRAITESQGAMVIVETVGMTRAPVFRIDNIVVGQRFCQWLDTQFPTIKKMLEATSSHLTLLSVKPYLLGQYVYPRFFFDTKDAMGMNMVTLALDKVIPFIEQETETACVSLSGNVCADKKANYLNFIEGRGIKVWADIVIPEKIMQNVLKTTLADMLETYQAKIHYGSVLSGSIGANAHMANVLSALFLATGQDIAHVAECAAGVTQLAGRSGDLYASIYLPDLVIGTVGGGTELPTQRDALKILGVQGGNDGQNALRLAEITAGALLAGELSLLASLSSGDLAKAHTKLGRGGNG